MQKFRSKILKKRASNAPNYYQALMETGFKRILALTLFSGFFFSIGKCIRNSIRPFRIDLFGFWVLYNACYTMDKKEVMAC